LPSFASGISILTLNVKGFYKQDTVVLGMNNLLPLFYIMKRILVTILSILYMLSATGASVHVHYCMGKLMSASFIHKDEDRCDKCCPKKSSKKGCCKDENKTFKTSDHQLAKASYDFSHEQLAIPSLPCYFPPTDRTYTNCINITAKAHAPPFLWRTCPIYIQVQNFRI